MVSIRARGFVATETWLDRLTRITPFFLLAVPILPYTLAQRPAAQTRPNGESNIQEGEHSGWTMLAVAARRSPCRSP